MKSTLRTGARREIKRKKRKKKKDRVGRYGGKKKVHRAQQEIGGKWGLI